MSSSISSRSAAQRGAPVVRGSAPSVRVASVAASPRVREPQRELRRSTTAAAEAPSAPSPSPTAPAVGRVRVLDDADLMQLGKSGLTVPVMGVGAWAWGDRSGYWGYGSQYGKEESRSAYDAIHKAFGDDAFIDTAEVYGFGRSEEYLGEFIRTTGTQPLVATKFAPLPWRLNADCVPEAARASLQRLGLPKMSLYMQHWPGFLVNAFSNEAYLDGLIKVHEQSLADAIGVSNFNESRVREGAKRLELAGVPMASNQIQYSLLYRKPEVTGVLEACKEFGVTPVAYSPMCQGLLTGKYTVAGEKPYGPRANLFTDSRIREVEPLLSCMRAISKEREKTLPQIAINWCICKGTLPIPGAKTEKQVNEAAGALGWRLTDGEVAELDRVSGKVPTSLGAPFEQW